MQKIKKLCTKSKADNGLKKLLFYDIRILKIIFYKGKSKYKKGNNFSKFDSFNFSSRSICFNRL